MADDPTSDALREAQDPTTSAARLQELAQVDRATWPAIAAHPAAYPGLLDWLGEHGDDDVRAAIAARGPEAGAATAEQTAVTQQIDPDATQQIDPTPTTVSPPVAAAAAAPVAAAASTLPPTGDEPSNRNRNGLLIALGVVVLLVVGGLVGAQALSGDDDGSDRPVASSDSSEPTAEPDPSGDVGSDEPTAPPSDSGDDDVEDFCESFEDVQQSGLGVSGVDGGSGTPDLSELQDSLDDVADSYEDLADDAPAEIKNEAAVLRDFFTSITDAQANPDGGAPFGDGDPSEYIAAATAVSQYYAANCG